jgi:steroid delta-isomerase-like uncharacterized protein
MSPDEMRKLGMLIYHEVLQEGRLEVADKLFAPDCIESSPGLPPDYPRTGPESVKVFATMLRTGFPDIKIHVHELLVAGDSGVGRVTYEGTHQGDFMGIPATGKRASWDGIDIVHVREGQVREHYGLVDQIGLMQQLGVIPTPEF